MDSKSRLNKVTPLMKQYLDIKSKYKDAILLFRMGDFYETFYEDAKIVSKILGITLTSRNYSDDIIPLAGFPIKSADMYIVKLVKTGRKIAVCEQLEEPKKGVKLVKRGVVEVITPGTLMRETLLNEKENNFIACYYMDNDKYALSLSDISTGEFKVIIFDNKEKLFDFIGKTQLSEIIEMQSKPILKDKPVRYAPDYYYSYEESERILKQHFNVNDLQGLGFMQNNKASIISAGALLQYIDENQKSNIKQIKKIQFEYDNDFMLIDEQTLRNLEIFKRNNGEYKNSFLDIIDKTSTPMGGRYLRYRLLHPFIKKDQIIESQSFIEKLISNKEIFKHIRSEIKEIGDIERIAARIITLRASARDVILLEHALQKIPIIKNMLNTININKFNSILHSLSKIVDLINAALDREKILAGRKERFIKKGFNEEYDKVFEISGNATNLIKQLETRERERTGINNLKIGYNNIAGYYIEITKSNSMKVPENYIWKQSLKNSTRYTNVKLKEYEEAILHADEKLNSLEKSIFKNILEIISNDYLLLKENASSIAEIDILLSFTLIAMENDYIKPEIIEEKEIFIENGRHPVVEAVENSGKFVPNNLKMDNNTRIILLTGPNMSGKSTYLRQNALIVYMAHIGMYVPAQYAKIPITDRIFTRIGASDDISRGVSTFMVEMLETANIINNMTGRSFIILDEIGRGTSTFDGLSIAWAIVEYLHNSDKQPNTLFATHYHELTELEVKLDKLKNYTTKIRKFNNRIVYMRKIVEGSSDESYGLEVAKMAGFPDSIVQNGYNILELLKENQENIKGKIREIEQLKLFENEEKIKYQESPIIKEIRELDINSLTPIEALLILEKLKKLIK